MITKITIILLSFSLIACASLPERSPSSSLKQFESLDEVNRFAESRVAALKKLDSYPTKQEFWQRFKFWRNWFSSEEELVFVTGIRASMPESIDEEVIAMPDESITNNQEAFVDEGGIVKRMGDYMIVLRRGKLYSVHIDEALTKVDELSVQRDNWKHEAWYDEMLAEDGRIVVVGYSYDVSATEYLFFDINAAGELSRGDVVLVSSSDYFSEQNYASRLVDGNLVFLIEDIPITEVVSDEGLSDAERPLINVHAASVNENGEMGEVYPLFATHEIYAPLTSDGDISATTVAICPFSERPLTCSATSILGGYTSESYASRNAYYLWMVGDEWDLPIESMSDKELEHYAWHGYLDRSADERVSALYRIPLDGGPVGVIKLKGQPIDQFSFKERGNSLNVVTRVTSDKSWYFSPVYGTGTTYYSSIDLDRFDSGIDELADYDYVELADDDSGEWLNRFIDDKLVYVFNPWDTEDDTELSRIRVFDTVTQQLINDLDIFAYVEQLQAVGEHALLIGYTDEDELFYASLSLENDGRGIVDSIEVGGYDLSESRSHGFFFKKLSQGGVFAIPADLESGDGRSWKKVGGMAYEREPITKMLYTHMADDLTMETAGELSGSDKVVWSLSADCEVSCADWYGSSRPIFWGGRIFALMKYELVEGRLVDGEVREVQRVSLQ